MFVADTSPLIHFAAADHLWVVERLLGRVRVPPIVREELVMARPTAPGTADILAAMETWLEVVQLPSQVQAQADGLAKRADVHPGEAAAIALALHLEGALLIDDLPGRRAAAAHGLKVVGTVGLLLKARKQHLIPAMKPLLLGMREAGLWISDALATEVLAKGGER